MKINYIEETNKIYDKIVNHRRTIHQNPELAFKEFKTRDYILSVLNSLGIDNRVCAETGVVAHIGKGDTCVALRADIDALPICEETGLDFASNNPGVMHACGHDMHTACLLGAAEILKANEARLNGVVKLIFQPAEECLPGGASLMIKDGVLDDPKPLAIFGQHVNPSDLEGVLSVVEGPVMASGDELYFTLKGKSSHAAQPHLGADPILAAAQLITYFQTMITKFRNPIDAGVLSITSIKGESVVNVFAEEVKLKGVMRTYNKEWREFMRLELPKRASEICALYNVECELRIDKGYPPLVNNYETSQFVKNMACELLGEDKVLRFEPKMWAEDFAVFTETLPGTFWYIGSKYTNEDAAYPIHNSKFNPSEKALVVGTAALVSAAHNFLENACK